MTEEKYGVSHAKNQSFNICRIETKHIFLQGRCYFLAKPDALWHRKSIGFHRNIIMGILWEVSLWVMPLCAGVWGWEELGKIIEHIKRARKLSTCEYSQYSQYNKS